MDSGIKFQDDQVTHHCNQAKKKKKILQKLWNASINMFPTWGNSDLGMCEGMLFIDKSFAGGCVYMGFPGGSVDKEPPYNTEDEGDVGLIPGSGRCPGEGNGNPLQCSHLENPMDSGAWWAIVHGLAKSQTWRKQLSTHACTGPLLLAYFLSFSPFIPIPAILRSKHIISLLLPILHTTRERLLFLEWEQRLFCRAQQRTGRVISLTGNIKLPTIVLLLL